MPVVNDHNQKLIYHYLDTFYRRKWYVVFPLLLGVAVALALCYWLPREYRSSTLILIERQKVPDAYVKSTVTSSIADRLNTIGQQIMSRTNLLKLVNEFNLYDKEVKTLGQEAVIEKLRSKVQFKVVGKESFSLSFSGEDPTTVMKVTSTLASLFIEGNLKVREQQAEGTSEFLQIEVDEAKKRLDQQDEALKRFKEKYMGKLPQQLDTNLKTLDRLQHDLQATTDLLHTTKEHSLSLEKQILDLEQETMSSSSNLNTSPEEASVRLQQLKKNLAELQVLYKENYPDVILMKEQIQNLESQMLKPNQDSKTVGTVELLRGNEKYRRFKEEYRQLLVELSVLQSKRDRLMAQIGDYEKRVELTPMVEERLKNILRDYNLSQNNYQILLEKNTNARISENLERRQKGEQFRIIDPANLPEKPYKPDIPKLILGVTFVGMVSGIGLALLIEMLNPCFRKPEDFEGVFNAPVLVSIPRFQKNKRTRERARNLHLMYGKKGKITHL